MSTWPRPVPLASFAAVIGVGGLGLALRLAVPLFGLPRWLAESVVALTIVLFVSLLLVWLARIRTHPQELAVERHVAITASYLGAIGIACSIVAADLLPYARALAAAIWVAAAIGSAALLLFLLGDWITRGIPAYELTPAVFIPVVGNAVSVYAAVGLGFADAGWMSFSFAAGCWLTLGPLTMYRLLVTEPRLPRKMAPQLGVLVSSPAVLASAWFALTDDVDPVFLVLTFKALFFALLAARLWRLAWGEPFNAATWGYTFPAAALAGALERGALARHDPIVTALAGIMLLIASLTVLACGTFTVRGWLRRFGRSARPVAVTAPPNAP